VIVLTRDVMDVGRMRRSSTLACGVALTLTLATASACGDDDGGSGTTGVGDPIRDGFDVVEGSAMIGRAFPAGVAYLQDGEPVVDDGFRALPVVRDGPRPVIEGYLAQARDLGLSDVEDPSCGEHELVDGVYSCSGFARTGDPADPRSVVLSFHRGRVGEATRFMVTHTVFRGPARSPAGD
jgi:hypothetical protein